MDSIKEKRQKLAADKRITSLSDSLQGVSKDVRQLLETLETSGAKKLDRKVVEAVGSLGKIVEAIKFIRISNDEDTKKALADIASILKGLKVDPVVNVSTPAVVVPEQKIDLTPLKGNIKVETTSNPLDGYVAQDINESDPNFQYVGLINKDGCWCIIENSLLDNSLRFTFGESGYKEAMKKPQKLTYRLYNEALNAKTKA